MTGRPPTVFRLAIAGLPLTINSSVVGLFEALVRTYGDYTVMENEAGPADWQMQVEIEDVRLAEGQPSFDPPARPLATLPGGLAYHDPVCQAEIYPGERRLALRSTCLNPLDTVEFFLRVAYGLLAHSRGGLLFHSAAVADGERAFIFYGHSGSGKTTTARLSAGRSLGHLVERRVLNDDLVILLPQDDQRWWVYPTPFTNPTQAAPAADPGGFPLAGLFHLQQSAQVYAEPLRRSAAVGEMVACAPLLAVAPALAEGVLDTVSRLAKAVPVYRLYFRKDPSFWEVVQGLFPG